MANEALQFLRANIGQEMTKSPSPVSKWLRGILREAEEGSVTIDFTVREEMTNPMGIMHGGIIATIIDDVLGISVFTLGREHFYTSVNLVIDFLESGKKGETITAKSTIIRAGKTIINAECHVYNQQGKLMAKGTSNLLTTQIKIKG